MEFMVEVNQFVVSTKERDNVYPIEDRMNG